MIVLSSLFLAWFLYRPVKLSLSDDDSNIAINKQRQVELEIDLSQGHIESAQYQEAESEIISTLASELKTSPAKNITIEPLKWIILMALLIGILSLLVYSQLAPKIIPNSDAALTEPMTMVESIEKLQDYLIENPNDFQALKMLGLAQVGTGNIDESIQSFEEAFVINPNDIDLLLQYASAIAANQDGMFYGKSKTLIEKALSLDPQSIQALYFAGIVSAHQSDLDGAIGYWQKALYLMPDNHPDRNIIEEALSTVLNLQVK
ncbi:MAG: c-type cytochrome biogenesis protein CcmI [Candidatus Thioglobus sp.]|nr:c-type cytochrome biogenesis protein CcmI [Candidatus Pseudothioglobus aerophilus]MBT7390342.1 c-type cytochrome biogenesis protein CcmI [Gammaproteobacteria bacterium]